MYNSCTTYEAPLGTSDNLNPHWYQSFLLCITASLCIFELCLLTFQDWIQIRTLDNLGTYINCNVKLQVMLLFLLSTSQLLAFRKWWTVWRQHRIWTPPRKSGAKWRGHLNPCPVSSLCAISIIFCKVQALPRDDSILINKGYLLLWKGAIQLALQTVGNMLSQCRKPWEHRTCGFIYWDVYMYMYATNGNSEKPVREGQSLLQ